MTTYPTKTHYSEHFSRRELDCSCGCRTPAAVAANLVKLASYLEILRSLAGRPLGVNCAYRCAKRNALVGGAKGSFHLTGQAADLDCRKGGRAEVERLANLAEAVGGFKPHGIGKYYEAKGLFVHVDFGPRFWRGVDGK